MPLLFGIIWVAWILPFRMGCQNSGGTQTAFQAAAHVPVGWMDATEFEPEQEDDGQDYFTEPTLNDHCFVSSNWGAGNLIHTTDWFSDGFVPQKIYIMIQKLLI